MNENKQQIRIGKIAKDLAVERFVIRFWEKEFGLKPQRSKGGQRFYRVQELETFITIKNLLYEKGFTIAGAKKMLQSPSSPAEIIKGNTMTPNKKMSIKKSFQKLLDIRKNLVELRKKLN